MGTLEVVLYVAEGISYWFAYISFKLDQRHLLAAFQPDKQASVLGPAGPALRALPFGPNTLSALAVGNDRLLVLEHWGGDGRGGLVAVDLDDQSVPVAHQEKHAD